MKFIYKFIEVGGIRNNGGSVNVSRVLRRTIDPSVDFDFRDDLSPTASRRARKKGERRNKKKEKRKKKEKQDRISRDDFILYRPSFELTGHARASGARAQMQFNGSRRDLFTTPLFAQYSGGY